MKNQIETILLMASPTAVVASFGALVAPGFRCLFGALAPGKGH